MAHKNTPSPLLLLAVALMASGSFVQAAPVTLPFIDDFNDTTVGPWVHNYGTWTHNGSALDVATGSGGNLVGGASVQTTALDGAVDFTASMEFDPSSTGASGWGAGFGLLSPSSNFGAAGNSYYLLDVVPNSGGQIRVYQINVSSGGSISVEAGFGGVNSGLSFSNSEVYTLTVDGTYGTGGLTLDYTVTSTGGDNVSLSFTDSTPLTGQNFGIQTYGGGKDMQFDNFSLAALGAAADPDLVLVAAPENIVVIGSSGVASTTATIRNDGATNTLTGTASVTGTGFSITSPTAISLTPGATQDITIQFDASTVTLETVYNATLTLATNDPVEPSVELGFTGLATTGPATTGLLAYESFETEATGAFDGTADQSWSLGVSDEQIVSESLSYVSGSVSVDGGSRALRLSDASNANPAVGFPFAASGDTLYFSFLTKVADGQFVQIGVTSGFSAVTENAASLAVDTRSSETAKARLYNDSESSKVESADLGYANGNLVFVVGRLSKDGSTNYNKLDLEMNPSSLTEPTNWDASLTLDTQVASMDHFVVRLFDSAASEYTWIDEIRIATAFSLVVPSGAPADPVLTQDTVNGDPDLDFGTVPGSGPFSESRTVRFTNDGPNNSIEISAATVTGDSSFSLSSVAINGGGAVSLPQTLAVGDFVDFTVTASLADPAAGVAGNLFIDTDEAGQDKNLTISGNFGTPPTLPPVTNDAPAAGKRVRVTAPNSGYEGNSNVYHTLYLPPGWTPGGNYPVIVEFAPNLTGSFAGTPEDTHLGFYQSGGTDYIWLSVPSIHENSTPGDKSDDYIATTWYGADKGDDAAYTMAAVIDVIENYGGDHSCVFATGFSRGAIACGEIARHDDSMADIWVGFLPYAHTDYGWYENAAAGVRTDRVSSRASLVTYGELDTAATNSRQGVDALTARGFPVESYEIAGTNHTDEWITDVNTPVASSASYTGHSGVADVRARMRAWLAETCASKPGTSSISGTVTDASGNPIVGARVQSGATHWTFTDATGAYQLAGLIDGARTVTISHENHQWSPDTLNATLAGADLTGQDFQALPELSFVITGMAWDVDGDLILDFTGPANGTFEVRKSLDLSVLPFPTAITAQNAPVTTDASGVGQAIINAADVTEPRAFFQLMQP